MTEYVHKDKTTIHEYVTSPSLDPVTATTPDVHGVYPVNPLGFPDIGICNDDWECLANGNPEFPQSKNFSIDTPSASTQADIEIGSPVGELDGTEIRIPVELLECTDAATKTYRVKVPGDIVSALVTAGKIKFGNAGYENYEVTGLFESSVNVRNPELDDGYTVFYTKVDGCKITGRVGAGRINVVLDVDGENVLLTAQKNPAENGLYQVTGDGEPWVRLASIAHVQMDPSELPYGENPYNDPASIDNSQVCGHIRHSYSDREVMEYVEEKAGEIIANATHPMSEPGDLAGAGQLTRWFVECGDVELGHSHNGGDSVTVEGFGLGGFSSGECTYGNMCSYHRRPKETDGIPVESPITTFSIGTKRTDSNDKLPRDWPFTPVSGFTGSNIENNITLLKTPIMTGSGKLGGLSFDITETCPMCGGTGIYEGLSCPECSGLGELVKAHSISNRVHLCVNNDFSADSDGNTSFKTTFVHLPAPIDTQDGDEIELTVSLPVVQGQDSYGNGTDAQKLSAYYAYISSPRVIVLSGHWKFSNTEVVWHESSQIGERTYSTGKIEIVDPDVEPFMVMEDGEPVPMGTRTKIRFTLDGGLNCPRYTDMSGVLTVNETGHIVISSLEGYPYTSRLRDTKMRICGVAYLDEEDKSTGTDNLLGLYSRTDTTLGSDAGSSESGKLDEFNKFIKPREPNSDDGRQGVCVGDARQIVATVYPTVTNTFPWALAGRHKMKHLDRLMTDEWDLGENSVSAMIWNSNRKLIDFPDTLSFFGYGDACYGFTADTMPVKYSVCNFASSSDKSVIGSQVRIKFDETHWDGAETNPVRQARKAAKMLADDFRKMRLFHGGKLPTISNASKIRVSGDPISGTLTDYRWLWNDAVEPTPEVQDNAISSDAWLSKARHLPEYVIVSGQDTYVAGNSIIGANPFVDSSVSGRYDAKFAKSKYGNTYYETKDGNEVIPCEVRLLGNDRAFAYRSVISARIESDSDAVKHPLFNDANRVAELQTVSIDNWKTGLDYDFQAPYDYLVDSADYQKWMDIYSATANVFSVDTIPVLGDIVTPPALPDAQSIFMSGDPFASYNRDAAEKIDFTATNLPFYDEESPRSIALTSMLRKMVSPYGAKMPVRFWDGTRVAIPTKWTDDTHKASWTDYDRMVYRTRVKWPEDECAMSAETRCDIVDDNFISRSANASVLDVNLNAVEMETSLHMDWSAPPVKARKTWRNWAAFAGTGEFAGPSGYVRVFMKFKFSAQAGRWYTVDYRQAPMSYLTPLYGANALEATVDGVRVWSESLCDNITEWKDIIMHPYYKYSPMDINPMAIPKLVENAPVDPDTIELENNTDLYTSRVSMPRLERPYMPVSEGGLGLNAPCDANGRSADPSIIPGMPHANFWSVRKHLRPAVSVLDGTDIPGYADGGVHSRAGGTMGDAVLWGQFDFPRKDMAHPTYIIPPCNFEEE